MFDIWASLAKLRQPCLYRPINGRQIGDDGLVRREVLASLDRLLIEHLSAGRSSFQAPPLPPPMPIEHRFLNVSALQKSIRRGDAKGAMRFAQQGCGVDAEHLFRRLAVCAIEDVGLGNLLAVGMTLAAMGDKRLRENGAPEELAAYLAYLLAISPKSRLACDLLSICDYDRSLDPLKRRLARTSNDELRGLAEDRNLPYAHRMTAAWLLAGPARFRGTTMPKVQRPRADIMRMMAASRMPLMLYYIADRSAGRLSDAMFVSLYLIAKIISSEPNIQALGGTQTDAVMIAGFPAAAFDLHTREGRLAIGRFGRECQPLAELLRHVSPGLRDTAIRHGVFIVEGGKLVNRLSFLIGDDIDDAAHHAELSFAGLTNPLDQAEFLATIECSLPMLHYLRDQAIESR